LVPDPTAAAASALTRASIGGRDAAPARAISRDSSIKRNRPKDIRSCRRDCAGVDEDRFMVERSQTIGQRGGPDRGSAERECPSHNQNRKAHLQIPPKIGGFCSSRFINETNASRLSQY